MRLSCSAWLCGVVVAGAAVHAMGQGQAVQLPTYSFTTTSTTVSVPDRGSAYLGGISRAETGRTELGTPILGKLPVAGRMFKNVGIGQTRGASSMHVTATIHDFDAMEEALLGGSPSSLSSSSPARGLGDTPAALAGRTLQPRNPAALAGSWAPRKADDSAVAGLTLADEQARRVAQQQTRVNEAEAFFERGRQAETDGKPAVARIYYQMVARRAAGDLKQQALARLEAISGTQSSPRIAQAAR
jgi:hypothetical protein